MTNPFDAVIDNIKAMGYHNQRLQTHSDIVSEGILTDLIEKCPNIKKDFENNEIKSWYNINTPGARSRKIDLLIGKQQQDGSPNLSELRICLENKSVITAHRNRDARYDDLNESLQVLHKEKPEAILLATVIVGTCDMVLNMPDRVKPFYKNKIEEFESSVVPRLSSGDESLLTEFAWAISNNRPKDPENTIKKFNELPKRESSHTHIEGYDFILQVPVSIDNIHPPELKRENTLGIDIDKEYEHMIHHICKTYNARWHI